MKIRGMVSLAMMRTTTLVTRVVYSQSITMIWNTKIKVLFFRCNTFNSQKLLGALDAEEPSLEGAPESIERLQWIDVID